MIEKVIEKINAAYQDFGWVILSLQRKIKKPFDYMRLEKWNKSDLVKRDVATSASDNREYPILCIAASQDDNFFKDFKRNSIYNMILEHLSFKQGKEYLQEIKTNSTKIGFTFQDWKNFHQNDKFGNPRKYSYEVLGRSVRLSPTTVRYVKVLQDILCLYDVAKIRRISEIGVGYGGQARIILSKISNIINYNLVDIPEVLLLAKKFLSNFPEEEKAFYIDGTQIGGVIKSDLVISNYAFSELVREVQDIYLKNIILCSERGYITWNNVSYEKFGGYSVEELLERIPGAVMVDEKPFTYKGNCLIVWGLKKTS